MPVLTVHTTADGLVVSPHERAYRDTVRRAGRGRLLKQLWLDRPGHCTYTDEETLQALDVLEQRLDRGRWPRGERGPDLRGLRAAAVPAAVRPRVAEVERPAGLRRGLSPRCGSASC